MLNIVYGKIDIDDPTGELAAQLTEKYLGTAEMGNFTSMTPGLTDVRKQRILHLIRPTFFPRKGRNSMRLKHEHKILRVSFSIRCLVCFS
jgi:hypothetical protein